MVQTPLVYRNQGQGIIFMSGFSHKLCGELGLVTLNYNFINLIKNGENKGLYVFEESFSNELVEKIKGEMDLFYL